MHFLCLDAIFPFDVIVVTPPTPEEGPSCISEKFPNYSSLINVRDAIRKTDRVWTAAQLWSTPEPRPCSELEKYLCFSAK